MADPLSKSKRSKVMSAIRSRGNKATELKLVAIFRSHRIKGWRRYANLPGKPDFVFTRERLAIFVDGCFWHGCRWHCRMPKSRSDYWIPKIARNKQRDFEIGSKLRSLGWRVYRIWEHSLAHPETILGRLDALLVSGLQNRSNTLKMPTLELTAQQLEELLSTLCKRITSDFETGAKYSDSAAFERRVRKELHGLLSNHGLSVPPDPEGQAFPDIRLGKVGVEVKFTAGDTWRSVANSIFEGTRDPKVEEIYVVFGKMGGEPGVRWGRYEECVIHVRTSHVPRFEVEVPPQNRDSLFKIFKISYKEFCQLSEHERMEHVRRYARDRLKLKPRELWWLEDKPDEGHALELEVRRWRHLTKEEKRRMRAEAYLLCPEILESKRGHQSDTSIGKYDNALLYLIRYRGVLAARDAFSAGSVAGSERGGEHVKRAITRIQDEIKKAAEELPDTLFQEYWGVSVPSQKRIEEWLKRADKAAGTSDEPWKPSEHLSKLRKT
jgi:DNA mismatch endonuclease Vsr